jgi:hypothetical protein
MTNYIKNILRAGLFALLVSCLQFDSTLEKVFDRQELQTVNKIIIFYDTFVLQQVESASTIDKAYNKFLSMNCQIAIDSGYLSVLLPDKNLKNEFYATLDKEALKEIFIISDTVKYYNRLNNEWISVYQPFSFTLNNDGQYFQLLKTLSTRNDFFKSYFESVENCGDLCPTNYAAILTGFHNIDFKKKEERLVLIINLLHAQETLNFVE